MLPPNIDQHKSPHPSENPPVLTDSLGYLLNRVYNEFRRRAEPAFAQTGVSTMRHYGVLCVLNMSGPLSQHVVGEIIGVDRTTMVKTVDDLEKLDFVLRKAHPTDRRAHQLEITGQGKASLMKARQIRNEIQEKFLSRFSKSERQQLLGLLQRLV